MAEEQASVSAFRLAVTPVHLVFSEILSVTSAMRKNSRWASTLPGPARPSNLATSMGLRVPPSGGEKTGRPTHEKQEAVLMGGFDQLKRTIYDVEDVISISLSTLLAPFLALIRSPLATGPITSTALASLLNFFASGLISPNCAETSKALVELSNALAHCKFEASDSAGDEVVLLRIVNVIDICQSSAVGHLLGDVELCEMLETVLTVCCQMRLSETLRRCAESAMNSMVRRVFARLDAVDPASDAEDAAASTPYGLPSAQELLRVLVNLLDPNDQQHTDSIRMSILGILNVGLESAGTRISKFPSLSSMLVDQGCKYLFQLARSDNINVLRLSLRVITTLFDTMRGDLKLQMELFISFTIDRLAPPIAFLPPKVQLSLNSGGQNRRNASLPGTPRPESAMSKIAGDASSIEALALEDSSTTGEQTPPPSRPGVIPAKGLTRDLMLETLGYIARQPTFMVDLWVNYDSDVNCEDLFERLIGFLTRGVYPTQYAGGLELQRYNAQLLCLDLLLAYVENMASRTEGAVDDWPATSPKPNALTENKANKGLLLTGASRFNTKPKIGLAFLEENGLIYKGEEKDIPRARTLAIFLKNTPRLDKKVLGDWISSPDQIEVLKEFIGLLDFQGKSVADAMRLLLESFRLPGEASPIARITETFADIYFASKPAEVKSTDAVYVLAYSVIMLNTDLYNPQNRKRMTLEDYQKNLKGVNDGSDFDPEYLKSIYDSIKKREIILPEEHSGQLGFEYAWKALLLRSKDAGTFVPCRTSLFDQAMFQLTWKSVISAIAFAFTAFDDDYVVERAIAGFRKCATLAGHFQLPEVFDYVVKSLSHATGLLAEPDPKTAKFPVVQLEGQTLTVSPLSIKFGTNFRGQLAAVVLFTVANGNGNAIREGWTLIFEMFQTLFVHSLLPSRMLQMEDFLGGVSAIPMQGTVPTSTQAMHRSDGGLLSALSSYLLTPYGASTDSLGGEPTQDDVENTQCAMDCITSCKLDELYSQITALHADALVAAIRSLQALADGRTVDILVDEIITDPLSSPAGSRVDEWKEAIPYDPSSVFLLEIMVSVTCQTKEYIDETWPMVFEHISGLLKNAERFSILLIERAVVGLLRVCLILAGKPSLRDQIYLSIDLLRSLPTNVTNAVAEQLAAGLALLVRDHSNIMSSPTEWGLVSALIRSTIPHSGAAKTSFALLQDLLAGEQRLVVTPENISVLVFLLEDFASAAGTAVEGKRQEQSRPSGGPSTTEPTIQRAIQAIDLISDLKANVPGFIKASSLPKGEAWLHFWMIPLDALGRQTSNACREVRYSALAYLQRVLLGSRLVDDVPEDFDFQVIFDRVVLPILEDLLKPQVFIRDPQGMSETRLRASTMLCKSFLHHSVRPTSSATDTTKLWIKILDVLDRLMNSGKRDQLASYEAVPESLKNVILVLNASQVLLPPQQPETRTPAQVEFWAATVERMEAFLPGFLDELVPTPSLPTEAGEAASGAAVA